MAQPDHSLEYAEEDDLFGSDDELTSSNPAIPLPLETVNHARPLISSSSSAGPSRSSTTLVSPRIPSTVSNPAKGKNTMVDAQKRMEELRAKKRSGVVEEWDGKGVDSLKSACILGEPPYITRMVRKKADDTFSY